MLGLKVDSDNWEQIWALLDEYGQLEYLYVIYDRKNRLAKFGKSVSPSARLRQLRTGNGNDIHLLAYCENKTPLTETNVHRELAEFRVSGEWFRMCPEVQMKIDEIRRSRGANRDGSTAGSGSSEKIRRLVRLQVSMRIPKHDEC